MIRALAAEITEAQLLIAGLVSGGGIVGIIVKWLVSSPERESAAYKAGVADEQTRCAEDIRELRERLTAQEKDFRERLSLQETETKKLRNALLRLAIAADLTVEQRTAISGVLGFDPLTITRGSEPREE